jgi:hypothetical protein
MGLRRIAQKCKPQTQVFTRGRGSITDFSSPGLIV